MELAEVVAAWAVRVARCPGGTSAVLFSALDLPGELVTSFGAEDVVPAPHGLTRMSVRGGVASMATVELWPAGMLTLGSLDACLGARHELPRVHHDDPHLSAYSVVSSDPPGRCTVFARSRGTSADSLVESVLLRTEPPPGA